MPADGVYEDKTEGESSIHSRPASKKHVFFCNNLCYVLLRLLEVRLLCFYAIQCKLTLPIQVVYSRLAHFKNLAASMANEPSRVGEGKMPSIANITKLDERAAHAEHFYDLMLESCERLFDNEIEQHVFEEQMRYMFGVKVCGP